MGAPRSHFVPKIFSFGFDQAGFATILRAGSAFSSISTSASFSTALASDFLSRCAYRMVTRRTEADIEEFFEDVRMIAESRDYEDPGDRQERGEN